MTKLIIIIILILCLIYYIYTTYKNNNNNIEGLLTFNGRMSIDDQYYYDTMFEDVVYYPNEYVTKSESGEEIGKLMKTGWMRCKEECAGNCTEFGVTGHSYCFAPK